MIKDIKNNRFCFNEFLLNHILNKPNTNKNFKIIMFTLEVFLVTNERKVKIIFKTHQG